MNKIKTLLCICTIFFFAMPSAANNGDTTIVQSHSAAHWSWYGSIDNWAVFPDTSYHFRKITLKYKLGCPTGGCSDWDYTTQIFVRRHTGTYDSTSAQLPYFTWNNTSPDSLLFSNTPTYTHFYATLAMGTDSSLASQFAIVLFQNSSTPSVPTDTIYGYPANFWNYNYDNAGNITDSVFVYSDTTMYNSWYTVYTPYEVIEQIEIARYITPYGGNLNSSWSNTWEFDVTDYATLLHDSVDIRAFYSGWSDGFTVTLDFEMIEGTPPRTPIRVTNLWSGYYGYGNPSNSIENYLTPKTILLAPNEVASNVRFDITGHGFGGTEDCAEFCPKMYYMKFDGITRYSKLVWRDKCGLNPMYPQPGTWLYDRANWCPGEAVHVFENEMTSYVVPGDSVVIDVDMEPFTNFNLSQGAGYQVDGQLLTFGAPNFTLDAELKEIIAPNKNPNVKRLNTICNKPIVVIRNVGSTVLTSLDIVYGVTGAPSSTFTWTGTLNFLEVDTVYLPTINWYGTAWEFSATVSNPNTSADQYADNNSLKVPYTAPPQYVADIVLDCRSNTQGYQTFYELTDAAGNVYFTRNGMPNTTTMRDTLHLLPGCYIFRMIDANKDGLAWWANNAGTGYMRIKNANTGIIIKTFNPDFGTEIYQEFTVGYSIGIEESKIESALFAYPNPTEGIVTIDFQSEDESVEILVLDYTGRIISDQQIQTERTMKSVNIDLSGNAAGIYFVQMRSSEGVRTVRVIKQ
ncbi:MAG: T9SS type A sorting domain-containing protein [Bacteroidota bacterium]|nr:T9SS type A sorting domain-containing protein [Bacteroidota bacterium]